MKTTSLINLRRLNGVGLLAALVTALAGCSGGGAPAAAPTSAAPTQKLQLVEDQGEPVQLTLGIKFPDPQPDSGGLATKAFIPNTQSLVITLTNPTVMTSSRILTLNNNIVSTCTMAAGSTCSLGPHASPAGLAAFTKLRPTTGYSITVQGYDAFDGVGNKKYYAEVTNFSLAEGAQYCPTSGPVVFPNCTVTITMHLLFLAGKVVF